EYIYKHFPRKSLLDYASMVENMTTRSSKKDTFIFNVDGCITVHFVSLLRDSGAFTPEEANEYIEFGTLNVMFVLGGRSIGFISNHLDQKNLCSSLPRHPASEGFIH
ncbi:hypothetical protein M378DRAFT_61383, partial [Amanita muscaria Koide BX008]